MNDLTLALARLLLLQISAHRASDTHQTSLYVIKGQVYGLHP